MSIIDILIAVIPETPQITKDSAFKNAIFFFFLKKTPLRHDNSYNLFQFNCMLFSQFITKSAQSQNFSAKFIEMQIEIGRSHDA